MIRFNLTHFNVFLVSAFSIFILKTNAQTFTEVTDFPIPYLEYSDASWGDYDNDGDMDILVCGSKSDDDEMLRIYTNNGDGTFTHNASIELPGSYRGKVCWGDFNNDGWLDFVATGISVDHSKKAFFYTNTQNGSFSKHPNDSISGNSINTLKLIDYDNDGDLDISTGQKYLNIYENRNNDFFEIKEKYFNQNSADTEAAWGDYNNDGFLDVLTTGGGSVTNFYKNNSDKTFSEIETGMLDLQHGESAWADSDNDGDLDVMITGYYSSQTRYKTKLYRNDGNGSFTKLTNMPFTNTQNSSIAWGDFDNDGDLDVAYSGSSTGSTLMYKNNGNNSFSLLSDLDFIHVQNGAVKCCDFDNDGDLDLLLTGAYGGTSLYRNESSNANIAPETPTNLKVETNNDETVFSWAAPSDDATPSAALSYNLRVGTSAGGNEVLSPMADANGYRKIVGMGNAQLDTTHILKNLEPGTYYWSVQAIDNSFAGGAFAEEQSFTVLGTTSAKNLGKVDKLFRAYPNPASSQITIDCANYKQAEIYNLSGTLIVSSQKKQIGIKNLKEGIYVLKVTTNDDQGLSQKIQIAK